MGIISERRNRVAHLVFTLAAFSFFACAGARPATESTRSGLSSGTETRSGSLASDPPDRIETSNATSPSSPMPDGSIAPPASSSPPSPSVATPAASHLVMGFVRDQSMSHTQVGFVVWRASGRDRVIDVGQFVGGCTQEGYAAAVPRSRTRGVLLGVVCDGRGVAAGALAVIDVVRSGNMLVVRTADVRAPGRRLAHDRVVTRVPLDGANEIRAATEEEMMRARDEIGSW